MASYNIILNSVNGVGSLNSNKVYYIDMNLLKPNDKPYEMSFSFISKVNNLASFSIPMVYLDLTQCNTYEANNTTGLSVSKYIGNLLPSQISSSAFLYINSYDNVPLYIDNLSIFNQLNVQIKTETGALWTDSVSADINSYVMNISLKPVKN